MNRRILAALAAALLAALTLAGCQFQIGGPNGCTITNLRMLFEHGKTTVVKYDMSCDSHPSYIVHGSAMTLLYLNQHRFPPVWEGAGKKFITLNSLPPANGKTYHFSFSGTCFPNTRERVHIYVTSQWPDGPDKVDRYVPRLGKATLGCGQARGE